MRALARGPRGFRAEVMAQPPADRLEYALGFLDLMCPKVALWDKTARDLGLANLKQRDAIVLHRLAISVGKVVSFDALAAACELKSFIDYENSLRCSISRLRRAFRAAGCPMFIDNVRSLGYRLEAAPELPMPRGWL